MRGDVHRGSLLVLDDLFPSLTTGFRVAEFSAYLDFWTDSVVLTDVASGVWDLWTESGNLDVERARYSACFPGHEDRIRAYDMGIPLQFELGYCVFANLTYRFLPVFEANNIPLVFTLYPGGGFALSDPKSDAKLQRIFSSPIFSHVIVTQPVTAEYLDERGWVDRHRVSYIFGGPLCISEGPLDRHLSKDSFDVCFVANRYAIGGADKGYDVFVEVAHRLKSEARIRFHVVGTFGPNDLDVSALGSRITFYGPRPNSFFPEFYRHMDAIVSPNRASVLTPGAFDGFPTGACAEAGAAGLVVLCSDPLGQNDRFSEEEIVLIGQDAGEIAERLLDLASSPDDAAARAARTAATFRRTYGFAQQMTPRLELLGSLMP